MTGPVRILLWCAGLALAALLVSFPLYANGYYLALGISVLYFTILATAWAMFSGPTRYVSLATVAFFGLGAYTAAVLGETMPWPVVLLAAAGVQAGDRLLAVDGRPVDTDTPVDTVTALIRGPVGSEVCLDLALGQAPTAHATPGSVEALTICIQRAEIQIPSVEWQLLESDSPGGPGIGYLKQSIFSERSVAEMEEAVAALQGLGADRFILDLRGNPGGLVDAAVGVAGLWLDAGPVLIEVRASGEEQEFSAPAGDISAGAPLVLIVDGASASASEIVAGALRDRGRAALVGEKTFGKGSVQLIHELLDESSLHVTTARWLTPDRHEIEGVGLLPEILVEPGADPLPIARDAVQEIVALGAAPAPAGE